MTVNILGQEYEIIKQTKEENPKLEDSYGLCEIYSKKIVVDDSIGKDNDKMCVENVDLFINKVMRHEVIHAFFGESGLDSNTDFARNEELVDWLAYQIPKIWKVFIELGIEK